MLLQRTTQCTLKVTIVNAIAISISLGQLLFVESFLLRRELGSSCHRLRALGQHVSIPILYENDNVIAISKPPNISHHDSEDEDGILTHIRYLQSKDDSNFTYEGRIFGVHRLDRVTSGILVLAKNPETAGLLASSFRNKDVTKYYIALSSKKPKKKKQGWVKGDMVKSRRKQWKLTSEKSNPAVSRFFTAGLGNIAMNDWPLYHHLSSQQITENNMLLPRTMILFHPHTGKTHQLRVAAKSLGLGILGDEIYGDSLDAQCIDRTYLHAIGFHVNIGGEDISIWDPPLDWFGTKSSSNDAESILKGLVEKHCNNEFILHAMSNCCHQK